MKRNAQKFWNWIIPAENEAEQVSERVLELYGTIAEDSWFDDDITPQMFHDELFAGTGPVTIWLNSPGGDCIAASRIYSMLMDYKYDVTVQIDGIAASAASVIAMAGTKVLMAPTAMMMIHNPATMAFGDHTDMQKAIDMLDEVKESIINAYEIKTALSRVTISHLMDQETWMNAARAIELGFADDMIIDEKKKKCEAYSFSNRKTERILQNKLEKKFPVPAQTETPVEEAVPEGTPIEDLDKRLNLLKP